MSAARSPSGTSSAFRRRGQGRKAPKLIPCLRSGRLEARHLLAGLAVPASLVPVVQFRATETVDQAQDLGDLSDSSAVAAIGNIGQGVAGAADVGWYHFTLDRPTHVTLEVGSAGASESLQGVVSLYNEDPFDLGDPLNPSGHRLTGQNVAAGPGNLATLDVSLPAGGYDVAVSGAGNRYFHPLVAGSGYAGSTGDYNLVASASPLKFAPTDGPAVLASDPAPDASIDRSPLAIRLELSAPLDPSTVSAGQTVRLLYNPDGKFGDGTDVAVALASVNYSTTANELQLFPARSLAPGSYKVIVSGDSSQGNAALASPSGVALGETTAYPHGHDDVFTFAVTGIEGAPVAPDTAATAHDLGVIAGSGLVQVWGSIGNDPFFDSTSTDPARNPGNGVEMYHFRVTGAGSYAFLAEVFAGRIGSPLDPGVALYRLDPTTQTLKLVVGNNNTGDPAAATDGSTPLSSDPALFASMTAGDYYVAVSSGANTPSPLEGQPTGTPGLYDPTLSHSGQNGFSTGPYELNLLVSSTAAAPRVVSTLPANAATLNAPPTALSVQFSGPVNLQQLAFQAYQLNTQSSLTPVYVLGLDGTRYFPRFGSFDAATDTANFLMLDALPNGTYELHLSGAAGLTDLAGDPLTGNTAGGDYLVPFTVNGPVRGDQGDPLTRTAAFDPSGRQDLGVLFPHELQTGVTLTRDYSADPTKAPPDTEDDYQFQVLQQQTYWFSINGTGLPANLPPGTSPLSLTDAAGNPVAFGPQGDGSIIQADLLPGTYVLHVGNWAPEQSAGVSYHLTMKLIGTADNPQPLVDGPSPALQIRLDSVTPTDTGSGTGGNGSGSQPGGGGSTGGGGVTTSAGSNGSSASVTPGGGITAFSGPVATLTGGSSGQPGTSTPSGGATAVGAFHSGGFATNGAVELVALGVGPVGGAGLASSTVVSAAETVVVALPSSTTPLQTSMPVRLASDRWEGDEAADVASLRSPTHQAELASDGEVNEVAPTDLAANTPPGNANTEGVPRVAGRWTILRNLHLKDQAQPAVPQEPVADVTAGQDAELTPVVEAAIAPEAKDEAADALRGQARLWGVSIAIATVAAIAFVRARSRSGVHAHSRPSAAANPPILRGLFIWQRRGVIEARRTRRRFSPVGR